VFAEGYAITNRHIATKINQQEATRAAIDSRLRDGPNVRRIMSFEEIKRTILTTLKRSYKFVRIVSLLEDLLIRL
jgi:hypothetical protein